MEFKNQLILERMFTHLLGVVCSLCQAPDPRSDRYLHYLRGVRLFPQSRNKYQQIQKYNQLEPQTQPEALQHPLNIEIKE